MDAKATHTAVVSDLGVGHRIASDGAGVYTNGAGGLVSRIQSVGDWELDLSGRRVTRSARIELTDPVPGNTVAAPFSSVLAKPRMIAKATQHATNGLYAMVGLGSTALTPLSVATIIVNGSTYAIRMNTANHSATDYALATCIAVMDPSNPATSACKQWRLTPNGSYDGVAKSIGRFEKTTTTPAQFLGYYYFTFDITLTR